MAGSVKFKTGFIDPRSAVTRGKLNQVVIKDIEDAARWGLHLSDVELAWLESHNPDTLGHTDPALRAGYWKRFVYHPASKPYRVQGINP